MEKLGIRELILYSVSVLTITGTTIIAPSLPEFNFQNLFSGIKADFLYRVTLTLPAFSTALTGLLLAILKNVPNRRNLLIVGLLSYAFFGSMGYFTNDVIKLIISRFFLGVSIAILMYSVTFFLAEGDNLKDIRKKFYDQSAFMGGANIFVSLISGFLATMEWKYPFFIYLVSLVLIPGVIITLNKTPLRAGFLPQNVEKKPKNPPTRTVLPLVFCVLAFLNMAIYFTIPSLLPYYIMDINSKVLPPVGIYLSFVCGIWCLSSLYFGRSRIFAKDFTSVIFGFIILGLGLFILGNSHSTWMIFISLFFIGAGLGLNVPGFNILIISASDERSLRFIIPILITAIYLGQFLAPTLAEPIIDILGLSLTFKVYGIISSVIAISGFTLWKWNLLRM
ncbi:putative MFS family arabinose efflux permease [Xenorhabdus cabanillasii]|uniref:Putative MFS family arabinose efflux permease n=1 Tax=Xenorhabdus cabanillasii TaxID=351673 RepID=A0A3D9UAA4_9GAMM|nr:MFS transporter [Xenorhabdus cabanillasii]REF26408.1 putative MFS family arabinose efflux permease [Xenorhabdus cabanillasii]